MAGGGPPSFISFTCAHCQALYHVVTVEAGPETTEAEVTCRTCGAPLPGREGTFVLKYFMLRHGARGTSQGDNLALVPNPCALRRRPTAGTVPATGRRRRCSAQIVADQDAVGGTWACCRSRLQSQKKASAGTEAVQRKNNTTLAR